MRPRTRPNKPSLAVRPSSQAWPRGPTAKLAARPNVQPFGLLVSSSRIGAPWARVPCLAPAFFSRLPRTPGQRALFFSFLATSPCLLSILFFPSRVGCLPTWPLATSPRPSLLLFLFLLLLPPAWHVLDRPSLLFTHAAWLASGYFPFCFPYYWDATYSIDLPPRQDHMLKWRAGHALHWTTPGNPSHVISNHYMHIFETGKEERSSLSKTFHTRH